jgi:hypothetical protein
MMSEQIENNLYMRLRRIIHEEISSHAQNFYNQIGSVVARLEKIEDKVLSMERKVELHDKMLSEASPFRR